MPKLSLYFDEHFPDQRWAKITYALETPSGITGEFVLGRSLVAALTFDVKSMSVRHAAIGYSYANDQWSISDLGSTNGTIMHGKKITGPTPLKVGDKFWLGPESKVFCVEDEQDTTELDEVGPPTVASTQPLAPSPPPAPPPAPPPPAPPPPPRTIADSIYLAAQWGISASTVAGKVYRILLLAGATAFVVVLIDLARG